MPLMTLEQIAARISRVFPAADVHLMPELETEVDVDDVEPGHWIDTLEHLLEVEDEFDQNLQLRARGLSTVLIRAILNVVEGSDTRGQTAFVPVDYYERYGAPEWPAGSIDFDDEAPPIDWVAPDDRMSTAWAWE
jgi:hypothetical protein